jgi:hypothetical protein
MTDLERDLRDMMHRTADGLQHTPVATPGLVRRARVRRATAILAGVAVLALVVGGFAATRSLFNDQALPPANSRPDGIFADVGGWIAYGNKNGIWAVDPAQSGDPDNQVQLSSKQGIPKAWSADGSKLLVLREAPNAEPGGINEMDLFVLNADGTETRLTDAHGWVTGGSFSPDGTEVVYAETGNPSSISVVDAKGGTPQLLRAPGRMWFPDEGRSVRMELYGATFSPDGTQIAYFEGMSRQNPLGLQHAHRLPIGSCPTALKVA